MTGYIIRPVTSQAPKTYADLDVARDVATRRANRTQKRQTIWYTYTTSNGRPTEDPVETIQPQSALSRRLDAALADLMAQGMTREEAISAYVQGRHPTREGSPSH